MRSFVIILCFWVFSISTGAMAASQSKPFCQSPKNDFENILCKNRDIYDAYNDLIKYNDKKVKILSENMKRLASLDFSGWRIFVDAVCSKRAAPNGAKNYVKDCANQNIRERKYFINKMYGCLGTDGCYIHVVDYEVVYRADRTDIEANRKNVFISESTNVIFDGRLKKISTKNYDWRPSIEIRTSDELIEDDTGCGGWENSKYTVYKSSNAKFINISRGVWGDSGGAHGCGSVFYLSYRRDDLSPMDDKIFNQQTNWQYVFHSLAVDDALKPRSYNDFDFYLGGSAGNHRNPYVDGASNEGFVSMVLDCSRWSFEEDYIGIYFNPYDFGSYISTIKELRVSYKHLLKFFSQDFLSYIKTKRGE